MVAGSYPHHHFTETPEGLLVHGTRHSSLLLISMTTRGTPPIPLYKVCQRQTTHDGMEKDRLHTKDLTMSYRLGVASGCLRSPESAPELAATTLSEATLCADRQTQPGTAATSDW